MRSGGATSARAPYRYRRFGKRENGIAATNRNREVSSPGSSRLDGRNREEVVIEPVA